MEEIRGGSPVVDLAAEENWIFQEAGVTEPSHAKTVNALLVESS
jgi:hypothetical protein